MVADIPIDPGRIGPVGLNRDHSKAMMFDQVSCDGRARIIEFRCAMGRFAEQNDLGIAEAVEKLPERLLLFGCRQRFGILPQRIDQPL